MKHIFTALIGFAAAFSCHAGMSNSLDKGVLYIIGDATPYSWDLGSAPEMARISDGVFRWQGELRADREFKFMNTRDSWSKHIVAVEPGCLVSVGGTYDLDFHANHTLSSDLDLKFKAPSVTAEYLVTVDLNCMKMSLEEAASPLAMPEKLYATGSALGGRFVELDRLGGVEFKAPLELEPGNILLTDSPAGTEGARWFGPLFDDVDISFGEGLKAPMVEATADSRGWSVACAGKYTMYATVDGDRAQGRPFRPKSALWIVGGCCEPGWDYSDEFKGRFVPSDINPEELVWEGYMGVGYGSSTEPEKFKILTARDWFRETYHPYTADAPAEGTGHFRTTGGDDYKWCISRDGDYRITVNTWKETLCVECLNPRQAADSNESTASISGLAADDSNMAGEAAVFDISGRRVAASGRLSSGVYIVVDRSGNTRKVLY